MGVAWDVTSAVYLQSKSVIAQDTSPLGIFFKPDGLKMYISGNQKDSVYEYDLSSAWNVTTATYLQSKSTTAQDSNPQSFFLHPDGTKMYVVGTISDSVYEYDLSSAWNVTTATYLQSKGTTAQDTSPQGLFFHTDGTKMYVAGTTKDSVYEYDLSSAWNVTTATYLQSKSTTAQASNPRGIFFKPDGTKMYVVGTISGSVYEYIIPSVNPIRLFWFAILASVKRIAGGNDANAVSLLPMDGADSSVTFSDIAIGGTHTWTANGNAQIDTAQSVFGGASGLFDGTGDNISTGDSADFAFGSDKFTIDMWVRFSTLTAGAYYQFVNRASDASNFMRFDYDVDNDRLRFLDYASAFTVFFYCTFNPSVDTWYHIAVVRDGTTEGTWHLFIDGVEQAKTLVLGAYNATLTDHTGDLTVGGNDVLANYHTGWIDELRISKGVARWTANFTPPTSAYS